jgi:hypothetical protein
MQMPHAVLISGLAIAAALAVLALDFRYIAAPAGGGACLDRWHGAWVSCIRQ